MEKELNKDVRKLRKYHKIVFTCSYFSLLGLNLSFVSFFVVCKENHQLKQVCSCYYMHTSHTWNFRGA